MCERWTLAIFEIIPIAWVASKILESAENFEALVSYIVMKINFMQNSAPIIATMMSFFSNLPVKIAITV